MWFRFRLSTLLLAVPLVGLATFAVLKLHERLVANDDVDFVFPCEPLMPTIAPAGWDGEEESPTAFPESDFGPIPVERAIRLP
jgi:hypothetical protein